MDGRKYGAAVGDIHEGADNPGLTAASEVGRGGGGALAFDIANKDIGPRFRETSGDRLAKPLPAAGNYCAAASQGDELGDRAVGHIGDRKHGSVSS